MNHRLRRIRQRSRLGRRRLPETENPTRAEEDDDRDDRADHEVGRSRVGDRHERAGHDDAEVASTSLAVFALRGAIRSSVPAGVSTERRRWFCPGGARSTKYIPPVNLVDLEKEALKLPIEERARLAEILLESLNTLSPDEHQRLWAEEAARRDAELDADPSMGRPADEVLRDARARLR